MSSPWSKVPKFEKFITLVVWPGFLLYSMYVFAMDNYKYFQNHPRDDYVPYELMEGWKLLAPRQKDDTDYQWRYFKLLFMKCLPWISAHLIGSEICRMLKFTEFLPYWQIFISFLFILTQLSASCLCLLTMQPIIFFTVMLWKKDAAYIWICNISCLVMLCYLKDLMAKYEGFDVFFLYSVLISIFWINLKCVGFWMDIIQTPQNNETPLTLCVNMFAYCFYFPTFFSGPFIPYVDFKSCQESHDSNRWKERLTRVLLDVIRMIFWYGIIEIMLHLVFVNRTLYNKQFILSLGPWSLYAFGFTMKQFFYLKHLILYGYGLCFAKFERVKTPLLPRCICWVHLYSDMWRYFDNGLYLFLLKYIYIPTQTSASFPVRNRFFSSFLCFCFIFLWHGSNTLILLWTILNYISILVEGIAKHMYEKHLQNLTIFKELSPIWITRISCIAASPLLAFSSLPTFYFLTTIEVGNIFVWRFLTGNWLDTTVLLIVLYTFCQASATLKQIKLVKKTTKTI